MTFSRPCILSFIFFAFTAPACAGDPYPSQLHVTFLAQPAPIIRNGTARLYCEMVITNFTMSTCAPANA
jgi:hypothetical protein